MGFWKWIGIAAAAVAALVVVLGLVLDDSETVEFGDATVELETTPGATDADNVRNLILQVQEQAGTTPEVMDCIRAELESTPDSELEELLELAQDVTPTGDPHSSLIRYGNRLTRPCIRGEVVREDLNENEVAILREGALRQLDAIADRVRIPPGQVSCLKGILEDLPAGELIEASNETIRENRARWARWGRTCG
jgi:hypothetical protein